jgi:ribosomal protein S14
LESEIERITKNLSDGQKDVLKAGLLSGWSTQSFFSKESIEEQILDSTKSELDTIIQKLMNHSPPLLERAGNGSNFRFTKTGVTAAKEIMKNVESYPLTTEKTIKVVNSYIGRGKNNKAMKAYAVENGAEFVKLESNRCSSCGHANLIFLKKGSKLLCQECFRRGNRF